MQETIRIRDAHFQDLAQLCAIAVAAKAHWGYDAAFMAACHEELVVRADHLKREIVRVAESDGGICGFYRLSVEEEAPEVEGFFVAPDRMGKGVGRALWADLREIAIRRRLARILCQSDPNAEAFYLRMGLVRIGSKPSGSIAGRELPMLEFIVRA